MFNWKWFSRNCYHVLKGWIALGSMILGVWFYELLYIYKTQKKLEKQTSKSQATTATKQVQTT